MKRSVYVAIYVNGERVVKLTEAPYSTFGISAIDATCFGNIVPTKASDKLIEFVGDSITCGYGVDDLDASHHFSTTTEDATKTYAYKTAEKLGADYSLVSFSGYGIISGYSGDGNKQEEQLVPEFYDKMGNSWGTYLGSFVPQETLWDFSRQSDAVIFATLGIMGADLYPCIEDAVERYVGEKNGDTKVHTMKFTDQSMLDGIAADGHPSEKTHEKAAEKLSQKIKEVMGW